MSKSLSVRHWPRVHAVQVPACFILLCNRSLLQKSRLELSVPEKVTFPLVHGSFATSRLSLGIAYVSIVDPQRRLPSSSRKTLSF
jgi:hypothetical protein